MEISLYAGREGRKQEAIFGGRCFGEGWCPCGVMELCGGEEIGLVAVVYRRNWELGRNLIFF